MFRELRRKKQALSQQDCTAILRRRTSGILALAEESRYPYAVPISYVYDGESLYFHCAKSGHKLDILQQNPRASFCVIDQDHVIPEEYTTYFRSVIVFGTLYILEEESEKHAAIEKLAIKYAPNDSEENRQKAITREWSSLCVLKMTCEHLSGKESIELVNQPRQPL